MAKIKNILCGDIGGTKTILRLAEIDENNVNIILQQHYKSTAFTDFNLIVSDFLSNINTPISTACFAVAGPVISYDDQQRAQITNLPWTIDTKQLSNQFNFTSCALINDFKAIGYALERIPDNEFFSLQSDNQTMYANKLIVGAGTGFGMAQLIWQKDHYQVIATEAGHSDFAPADELQLELTRYLIKRYGRCAIEFVLSGPGLVNIYSFFAYRNQQENSTHVKATLSSDDPAAIISHSASLSNDPISTQAMECFIRCYGSQTGNLALSSLALGGVYIAGGIAPKIINQLQNGGFIESFNNKGKMSQLIEGVAVNVIMNPEAGLLGSQRMAEEIALQTLK